MRLLGVLLVGVAVEGMVVRNAMGLSLSRILPAQTRLALNGSDARTLATATTPLIAAGSPGDARKAWDYAQRALLRDPIVVVAARNGGLAAGLLGQAAPLQRRLNYALWLSRRDLPTLLWHIEERVAANDLPGTLRYYDIALRASRNAGATLVPVLVEAASDASTRNAIVAYLARHRPPWTRSYYDASLRNSRDWQALASLTRGLLAAGIALPDDVTDQAIRTVAEAGHPAEAFEMYLGKAGAAGRRPLRNGDFSVAGGRSPFDWNPTQDVGRQATIVDGQLQIDVVRDSNGAMVRQLLMLRPGRYRLRARLAIDGEAPAALPYWSISCLAQAGEVGRVETATAPRSAPGWSGAFTIPSDCAAQWLTLNARAADTAASFRVDDASIDAVR